MKPVLFCLVVCEKFASCISSYGKWVKILAKLLIILGKYKCLIQSKIIYFIGCLMALIFMVSKLSKIVGLSSVFCKGYTSVFKKRLEVSCPGAKVTALGAKDHLLSHILCWGAVAGVASTPGISVKDLYLVSLAPHKGGCLWLPNFLGKGETREGKSLLWLLKIIINF